jgi:hypothetical protein
LFASFSLAFIAFNFCSPHDKGTSPCCCSAAIGAIQSLPAPSNCQYPGAPDVH